MVGLIEMVDVGAESVRHEAAFIAAAQLGSIAVDVGHEFRGQAEDHPLLFAPVIVSWAGHRSPPGARPVCFSPQYIPEYEFRSTAPAFARGDVIEARSTRASAPRTRRKGLL